MTIKTNSIKKYFTILLVLMPILNIYAFPGVPALGLGEPFALLFAVLIVIVGMKDKFRIWPPSYWLFVLYLTTISLIMTMAISSYSIGNTVNSIVRVLFYTLIIFGIAKNDLDLRLFKKVYLTICFIASVYLILQFLSMILFRVYIPSTFSNLQIMYSEYTGITYNQHVLNAYNLVYRPQGFFAEPAHFCEYTVYALPLALMSKQRKGKETLVAIITAIAILISQSAIGYFCLAAIVVINVIHTRKSRNVYASIGIILVAALFIFISINYGYLDLAVGRTDVVSGSGGTRVLRGFAIYNNLPTIFKLIGIGMGNYASFAQKYNISTIYDPLGNSSSTYMNLISTTLVYTGIIGFLIYMYSLLKATYKTNIVRVSCLILFLLIAASSNILYFSAIYIIPMLFIYYDVENVSNYSEI